VGRASKHKKPRRSVARPARVAGPAVQAEGKKQIRLLAGMQASDRIFKEREQIYAQACRAWCGGRETLRPATPSWAHGKFGERFAANPFLREAQNAPCLATAVVPPAVEVTDDPTQWHVAVNALIRAVAFDGLGADHPAVSGLLNALAPVAVAELRYWPAVVSWLRSEERQRNQPAPGFPVLDGPVALLGMYILADAALAVTGSDPGNEELAVLSRALDGTIPGVPGSVVADALTRGINPLQALAAADAVQPSEVLGAGLATLEALVSLFETDAENHYRRAA
jgi:hypothetical protein